LDLSGTKVTGIGVLRTLSFKRLMVHQRLMEVRQSFHTGWEDVSAKSRKRFEFQVSGFGFPEANLKPQT